MFEGFQLETHQALIESRWREKNLLAAEILGQASHRAMRPNLIGDRSRLDLMSLEGRLGLKENDVFFELPACDTPTSEIQTALAWLKKNPLPLRLAQIRLRSSPKSGCGIWIDCPNSDIKELLDSKLWLEKAVSENLVVELGQKHKEYQPAARLVEATPRAWLDSFDVDNNEIPLSFTIAQFSQPGSEVNRALIATAFELLDEASLSKLSWAEWGAGYGNLSAAFYSRLGPQAYISEMDPHGVDLLKQNARFFQDATLELNRAGFDAIPDADLWLIDPPRPGFGKLLEKIPQLSHTPQWVLAYHCHGSGLLKDSKFLREGGYRLFKWSSVDAFPATPHHEVISLWEKK